MYGYPVEDIIYFPKQEENENIKFENITRLTTKHSIENNIRLPNYKRTIKRIFKLRSLWGKRTAHIIKKLPKYPEKKIRKRQENMNKSKERIIFIYFIYQILAEKLIHN
jgi:hypothetical protein